MESSRIFVKGLPPSFTEAEFRKHFAQKHEITDAKIFQNRRIGYIGYRTPEDAQAAVKYYNRTFIRMSRIGVELARPPQDAAERASQRNGGGAPTARKEAGQGTGITQGQDRKGQKASEGTEEQDPKLKEFLEAYRPRSKKRAREDEQLEAIEHQPALEESVQAGGDQSDEEYADVPSKPKRSKKDSPDPPQPAESKTEHVPAGGPGEDNEVKDAPEPVEQDAQPAVTDSDWARSRTSRLLGLLDDDEEDEATNAQTLASRGESPAEDESEPEKGTSNLQPAEEAESALPTPPSEGAEDEGDGSKPEADVNAVRTSMRLFLRNLPYDIKREDLEAEYERFGHIDEVHVPLDTKTGAAKGFAYVQFSDPDAAETALLETDGQTFQGRLLHVLPASKKRETKLDDFELSKLPLKKQQQIKRKRDAASTTFNWNALYMNADAVVSSVANRLGLAKSEVLDPTSSDAAIKQAHAETHIIQETKTYFKQHGIDLDAFKKSQRGDTAILVKNIPYDCSKDELRRLFEEHGELKKFLMPPAETIAIIEYPNAAQCKTAFGALAYRKIKGSVLFLEKAPKGLFEGKAVPVTEQENRDGVSKTSASDLKDSDHAVRNNSGTATLFVRNLNFTTTTQQLTDTFLPLEGFLSARVKTKTDPKKPGQLLSMGFGFLEFRTAPQAQSALKAMDGYTLEGHKLQIRASHKGADAAESRRLADAEKRAASKKTKVVIKNLPFEASKKDVRALFGAYGQLRSVRVPKKMDRAARGFAFADFTTPKEAENAIEALRDTHLLGRRLVLDFAEEEPEDAEKEIEKMQQKVGAQVNKVALQKLTSGGRKKFLTQQEDGEE
ncbi:Multiple RNA-binding domain-containing protein 1 [Saxophila tyrrhenica]|uniref:Multiple RNA-binding domain-containing protein 1 n=1 Tax=Saxophila tyrrhenica TaxID=1690608 RepID=A0AAV9PD76_9PEZI|nr:Multiple RNA-binding domain-containing protein 1 [Saxophila tyrrhenica]